MTHRGRRRRPTAPADLASGGMGAAERDPTAFRAEFPVLERVAYLNAGTDGPVPRRAAEAAEERLRLELRAGRASLAHWQSLEEIKEEVRDRLAALLGCRAEEVALTHSTTDGINAVLSALELGPGDEVLTSDEEHPGLLAPLEAARRRRGFGVRTVPFAEIGGELRESTRLVACSHVSWVSGRVVDAPALAASDAMVLLDGAQGLGAVASRVTELGCDFYAAAGQKWLCGPDGSGCLYVRADRAEALAPPWPNFECLSDPGRPLELEVHGGGRRFDMGSVSGPLAAWWLAALRLLDEAGWEWLLARGPALAAHFSRLLEERRIEVVPRGESTLVSWRVEDPEAAVERLAAEGYLVRHLPGRGLVRASVGAWSSEAELERLAALAG